MRPQINPGDLLDRLAPGVLGHAEEDEKEIWIGFILAEREGNGDVGRYLDSLPRSKHIAVPNVISARLAGMLLRRGFRPERREVPVGDETEVIEMYVRPAASEEGGD